MPVPMSVILNKKGEGLGSNKACAECTRCLGSIPSTSKKRKMRKWHFRNYFKISVLHTNVKHTAKAIIK
jgi:hypothetical protein